MNLMELFVKIGVDDQASSKVGSITDKVGGGLKTAANIGVKANGTNEYKVAYGATVEITAVTASGYILDTITLNGDEVLTEENTSNQGLVYTYVYTFVEKTTTNVSTWDGTI
jgi:hypothetical protein